ncbi:MAG TPA: hypothetical protein VF092_14670 [Longimicrobium sp.]
MSETLFLTLTDQLAADLESFARADGMTREELLLSAIQQYVAERKFDALRSRVMPQARRAGFSTDDDVFRSIS